MRRVFENSVKAAHSTSIARPCDGGVSELFRSCFFALAMFSRQRRENIASVPAGLFSPCGLKTHGLQVRFAHPPNCAPCRRGPPGVPHGLFSPFGLKTHMLQVRFAHPSNCALTRFARQRRANPASVPAGLLAPWAKRTASRSAKADPPNCAPGGRGPPGVPHGLFSPFGLKTHGLQVRFAHPSNCAPRGQSPPGVPHGLFSPCGLKTHMLQVRFAPPPNFAPVGQSPPGVPAGLLALWAKRTASRFASLTLRTAPRACVARPGVPHGFQARTGWTRVLVRLGC